MGCYYPFGLKHKGYNNVVNGVHHPYGYNGKEHQDELGLGWIDLGARNMDPAIGRFINIDPLADIVNYQSPYVMADNNPIYYVDIHGLQSRPGNWFQRLWDRVFRRPGRRKYHHPPRARRPKRTRSRRSSGRSKRTGGKKKTTTTAQSRRSGNSVVTISSIGISNFNIQTPTSNIIPRPPTVAKFIPPPPPPWYENKRYGILAKEETVNMYWKADRTTKTTMAINMRLSGINLGRILKTLSLNPMLKLYIEKSKITSGPGKDHYLKKANVLAQYLKSEGISSNRIIINVNEAIKRHRTYIK